MLLVHNNITLITLGLILNQWFFYHIFHLLDKILISYNPIYYYCFFRYWWKQILYACSMYTQISNVCTCDMCIVYTYTAIYVQLYIQGSSYSIHPLSITENSSENKKLEMRQKYCQHANSSLDHNSRYLLKYISFYILTDICWNIYPFIS